MKSIRDCSGNTQLLFSGIINREDWNYNDKISEINTRMASYSESQKLIFINNNDINRTPAGIYLLKVNNRNTRTRCEICSKLTIKTPERRLASFWCLYC